jgi:hypothetical protein
MKRWPILSLLLIAGAAAGQTLVDWTQGPGRLGLGYPVPIPEDTPMPFDGFRSYAGLHARHQQLLLEAPGFSGEVVGQTLRGRDIWLYRYGDPVAPDLEGRARPAILINGGIHAREWQSPEVVTGLMELLAAGGDDRHWLSYLRENTNILMLPVLNIDGFLQTQRYPRSNFLDSDPQYPQSAPRDGRMRRKNLRNADEDLFSIGDHLFGVDLNRNSAPFWPGPPVNLSPTGLTHAGAFPASEPEIQALQAAAVAAPGERLRFFADMHSFARVLFSIQTGNTRRDQIQGNLLAMASQHHRALPGGVVYTDLPEPPNAGIGTTSEYFAHAWQIPALTWELEPGSGGGVEYGGFGTNGHDGFILPESQIRRVRDNMAQTLAAVGYHMAGPPHLLALQVIDEASGALVLDRQWRPGGPAGQRSLDQRQLRAIEPGRPYLVWLAFSKPMRWRDDDGVVVPFPGRAESTIATAIELRLGGQPLAAQIGPPQWSAQAAMSPQGFRRYRDDAFAVRVLVPDSVENRARIQQAGPDARATLSVDVRDMTGHRLDALPATPVDWQGGHWQGYEDADGIAADTGGPDRQQQLPLTASAQGSLLPIDPGHSGGWFDPARSGEGFLLENIDGERAQVYWFTYDEHGAQRWLSGLGEIQGNRIRFPQLFVTRGGRFGPAFDPALIEREVVAAGEFWFGGCDQGWFDYEGLGGRGRFQLVRTGRPMGVDCAPPPGAIADPRAGQGGSWYDPSHSGEGFVLQWLGNGEMLLMWFSYDPDGRQYWMVGTGRLEGDEVVFRDLHATRGGVFGPGFDPARVERFFWGDLRLRLGCQRGEAHYDSVLPGFGAGSFDLHRLTGLQGLDCQGP